MKNRSKLLTIALMVVAMHGAIQGQIKIEQTGRVVVGPQYGNNFDPQNVLSMSIQGPYTESGNSGSKLAFGDFGQIVGSGIGGWNVFIGEYGTHDSDQMWLHGKKGIRLTSDNGNTVLAEFGCDESTRTYVFYDLYAGQLMVSSEDSYKTRISPISGALSRLLQLGSISYRYVLPRDYALTTEGRAQLAETDSRQNVGMPLSGKDLEDSVRMAYQDSIRAEGTSQYGFITAELQQLFPELVTTDADGKKYVDYIGMIPVIVAALGEQQRTIEALTVQLQECCSCSTRSSDDEEETPSVRSLARPVSNDDGTEEAELYQNIPNPFRQTTVIEYYVPQDAQSSTLYVFSLSGTLMQTLPIATTGRGAVTISEATLPAGMYVYSLVVDGRIVDSKRMILTE